RKLAGNGTRGFEHAHCSTHIVRRSRRPSIAVPSDNDQLVGKLNTTNDAERVVNRLERLRRAVIRHRDPRTYGSGPNVVVKGKAALPATRHAHTPGFLQELSRVAVADRDDGDARNFHLLRSEARGATSAWI